MTGDSRRSCGGPEPSTTLVKRGAPYPRLSVAVADTTASQSEPEPMDLPAAPTVDAEWLFVEEGFTLAREHEVESLFAIGNGYVGVRGSLAEGCALSAPATFAAGVYDSVGGSVPELARLADWTRVCVSVEGHPLRLDQGHFLEHRRILDCGRGFSGGNGVIRTEADESLGYGSCALHLCPIVISWSSR